MERKPLEEMLEAEKAGTFRFSDSSDVLSTKSAPSEASSTQALTDRLDSLIIESSVKSNNNGASLASAGPEMPIKTSSTSRPLAMDDDLDDLDLDENIDTTVRIISLISRKNQYFENFVE